MGREGGRREDRPIGGRGVVGPDQGGQCAVGPTSYWPAHRANGQTGLPCVSAGMPASPALPGLSGRGGAFCLVLPPLVCSQGQNQLESSLSREGRGLC